MYILLRVCAAPSADIVGCGLAVDHGLFRSRVAHTLASPVGLFGRALARVFGLFRPTLCDTFVPSACSGLRYVTSTLTFAAPPVRRA